MWRKQNEAKPSSNASNAPAPAPVKTQETPQASFEQTANVSAKVSAPPAPEPAPIAAAPAPNPAPVSVAPTPSVDPVPARISGGSSTISAGLKIKGEITGTADLVIDGDTQGKIRIANGRVTVASNGRVNADIDAREIVVNGAVQGNLRATESVRLGANSHVEGSVLTPRIGIDDGARLRGNVEMTRAGEAPAAPEPAKAAAVRAGSRED